MAIPENLDFSGFLPPETPNDWGAALRDLETNLVEQENGWRVATVSSRSDALNPTDFALQFAVQTAQSFDAVKYIPLDQTPTPQAILDWLSGFLNTYEKQLKSKQITNFAHNKNKNTSLDRTLSPLLKLLTLRKLLLIFDATATPPEAQTRELLDMLVQNVPGPSRFILLGTLPLSLAEVPAAEVGSIALGALTEADETTNNNHESEADNPMADEAKKQTDEPTPAASPTEEATTQEAATTEEATTEAKTSADEQPDDSSAGDDDSKAEPVAEEPKEQPAEETAAAEVDPPAPEAELPADLAGKSADELLNIGQKLVEESEHSEAKTVYEQALARYVQENNHAGASAAREALGTLYILNGDYAQAFGCYEDALKDKKALNDKDGMVEVLNQLTLLSQLQGDAAQARAYTQQAADLQGAELETA